MATRSLFDQLVNTFGNAVTDVREKLVEEAWFGRTTAPQERMSQDVSDTLGQQASVQAPAAPTAFDRMVGEFVPQRAQDAVHFDRDMGRFSNEPGPSRSTFDSLLEQHQARTGKEQEPDKEREDLQDRDMER